MHTAFNISGVEKWCEIIARYVLQQIIFRVVPFNVLWLACYGGFPAGQHWKVTKHIEQFLKLSRWIITISVIPNCKVPDAFNKYCTKMKFAIKYFFSKCDQIHSFLRIWSHLRKKSLMKKWVCCASVYQ